MPRLVACMILRPEDEPFARHHSKHSALICYSTVGYCFTRVSVCYPTPALVGDLLPIRDRHRGCASLYNPLVRAIVALIVTGAVITDSHAVFVIRGGSSGRFDIGYRLEGIHGVVVVESLVLVVLLLGARVPATECVYPVSSRVGGWLCRALSGCAEDSRGDVVDEHL